MGNLLTSVPKSEVFTRPVPMVAPAEKVVGGRF